MLTARVLHIRIFVLTSIVLFVSSGAYACNCTEASLYGDRIDVYMLPKAQQQVTVNAAVELPKTNKQIVPNSTPHHFSIDIEKSSILIDFEQNANDDLSGYGNSPSFHFDNINPQLPGSNCTTKVAGMYIQTNNPQATSLNAKSTFSDHAVNIVLSDNTLGGYNNLLSQWTENHWIKVNLTFGCSVPPPLQTRNGMTWGYRSQSIPGGLEKLVEVGCNSATEWSAGQSKCNPYIGETSCSVKRPVLCVKENDDIPRPAYSVNPGKENFTGWSPGAIKLSPAINGTQLTSLVVANDFCGSGWRMAGFHDGHWIQGMDAQNYHEHSNPPWELAAANSSGGWNFHAQLEGNNNMLDQLKTQRFWVYIKDQPANCWNPVKTAE